MPGQTRAARWGWMRIGRGQQTPWAQLRLRCSGLALSLAVFTTLGSASPATADFVPYEPGDTAALFDSTVVNPASGEFWDARDPRFRAQSALRCEQRGPRDETDARLSRVASADGQRFWALAYLYNEGEFGTLGYSPIDTTRATNRQFEVCQRMVADVLAPDRNGDTRSLGLMWLLRSEDRGQSWMYVSRIPTPGGAFRGPDEREMSLQTAAGNAVRAGNAAVGWTVYDPGARTFSPYGQLGEKFGWDDEDRQRYGWSFGFPESAGSDPSDSRRLASGAFWWAELTRTSLRVKRTDSAAVVTSQPRFRVRTAGRPPVKGVQRPRSCRAYKTMPTRGLDQVALADDGRTVFGLQQPQAITRCFGERATYNLKPSLVISKDAGRTWRTVRTPSQPDDVHGADGDAVLVSWASNRCRRDGDRLIRRYSSERWTQIGCRPIVNT